MARCLQRHARYTLNIKGIPYRTVWVEYPDVEALCKKIGAPPTGTRTDGSSLYTLPTIYDPNTEQAISDSAAITRYLDKTYPSKGPILIPPETDALHAAFQTAFLSSTFITATFAKGPFGPIILPPTCAVLNPRSDEYFRRERGDVFGPLDELAPFGSEKRAGHWKDLGKVYSMFAGWLGTDVYGKERLFFMGGEGICYADVTLAGFFKSMQKVLPTEEWDDLTAWDGGRWARFVEKFQPYEAVDSGSVLEL